jgi:hypothetical protein
LKDGRKLDKSAVRDHIRSLELYEISDLIIDVSRELTGRAGDYVATEAYLNLAYHSLREKI